MMQHDNKAETNAYIMVILTLSFINTTLIKGVMYFEVLIIQNCNQ
jgi:hypothetical protein